MKKVSRDFVVAALQSARRDHLGDRDVFRRNGLVQEAGDCDLKVWLYDYAINHLPYVGTLRVLQRCLYDTISQTALSHREGDVCVATVREIVATIRANA